MSAIPGTARIYDLRERRERKALGRGLINGLLLSVLFWAPVLWLLMWWAR